MEKIKIRSISNGAFVVLFVCAVTLLLIPLCFIIAAHDALDNSYVEPAIKIMISALILIPAVLLAVYALYHYRKYAIITSETISIFIPMHKKCVITADDLCAFGTVCFVPRSTQLYLCTAQKDSVIRYYEDHLEECKTLFRNLPFEKLCHTESGIWMMAVGIYVHHKQQGVYFLGQGNAKRVALLEYTFGQQAISIDIFADLSQ